LKDGGGGSKGGETQGKEGHSQKKKTFWGREDRGLKNKKSFTGKGPPGKRGAKKGGKKLRKKKKNKAPYRHKVGRSLSNTKEKKKKEIGKEGQKGAG